MTEMEWSCKDFKAAMTQFNEGKCDYNIWKYRNSQLRNTKCKKKLNEILELKNTISDFKKSLRRPSSRMKMTEGINSELEDRLIEIFSIWRREKGKFWK